MEQKDYMKLLNSFAILKEYFDEHGTSVVVDREKYREATSVSDSLRNLYHKYDGKIPTKIREQYEAINMVWTVEEASRVRKELIQHEIKKVKEEQWEPTFQLAKKYYELFGSLTMPKNFEMYGVALGQWVEEQKQSYSKMELSIDRAYRLSEIGISWNSDKDHVSYDESIIAYYIGKCFPDTISSYRPEELKGKELDIYIPSLKTGIEFDGKYHKNTLNKDLEKNRLCEENGYKLIRVRPNNLPKMESTENCTVVPMIGKPKHNEPKVRAVKLVLTELGVSPQKMPSIDVNRDKHEILGIMIEDKTYFNQYLMAASKFAKTRGHLLVPRGYADPTGLRLGEWIHNIRSSRKWLTERQINALDEYGMVWRDVDKAKWLTNFEMAASYKEIPEYAQTVSGKPLKAWFDKVMNSYEQSNTKEDYKIQAIEEFKNKNKLRNKNRDADER